MKYITVRQGELKKDVISKMRRELGSYFPALYSIDQPLQLMGNSKVLSLRVRGVNNIYLKVDGPGFIIDELFNHFL